MAMKILIAYYSRTGNTRRVAEALAEVLRSGQEPGVEVVLEEIIDRKSRKGLMGFLGGGLDATFKSATDIEPPGNNPGDFDLVVVGTPVWAWTAAPAALTYCRRRCRGAARRAAFFCTMGSSGDRGTFSAMQEAVGDDPVATLALKDRQVKKAESPAALVEGFAGRLLNE